jgi:hypothetical protein
LTVEIETARDCLLCQAAKARYDAELRRRGTVAQVVAGSAPDEDPGAAVRPTVRRRAPTPWWRAQWFQIPVGGIAGILIALPLANMIRDWRRGATVNQAAAESTPPAAWPLAAPETQLQAAEDPAELPAADELETDAPETDAPETDAPMPDEAADGSSEASGIELQVTETAEAIAAEDAEDEAPGGEDAAEQAMPDDPVPAPAALAAVQPGKLPVPGEAEQREAQQHIHKLLREELETVKTRDQALAVVKRLVELAKQSQGEPALRYALLQLAQERAAAAGSLPLALDAIDQIAAVYDVDPWARKTAALTATLDAVRQARDPSVSGEATLAAAGTLVTEAVTADAYPAAREMMTLLITAAQRAKLAPLARDLAKREREIRRREEGFTAYESARAVLATEADHGAANLTAGRWLAFVKGRWDEALPLLAQGSDAALAQLAQQDLAAPTASEAQAELAGGWWKQCSAESGMDRAMAARRAVFWYDQALASLTGLPKIEADQNRLEALSIMGDPEAGKVAGAVEVGDVALATKGATLVGAGIGTPANLLDGVVSAYASQKCPCEWTIVLGKVYRLQEIRLHLYVPTTYSYHYGIATSSDGRKFVPLAERTSDRNAKFEQIRFEARPVVAIKVLGMASTRSKMFYATELEAHCIPPDVVAGR